jgi:formate dehydrogenase subunit gamma
VCRSLSAGDRAAQDERERHNAGQKVVFWSMALLITLLIVSRLAIWNRNFVEFTTPNRNASPCSSTRLRR